MTAAPVPASVPASAGSRKVVIDAGAAIKLQRLERFGGELFTTSGVLAEVRDENARALLKTLPEEIRLREPLPQDITFVKQFAKATGDFGFLSQNDMDLIALTVGLHREAGGTVRERPAALLTEEGRGGFEWSPAPARAVPSIARREGAAKEGDAVNAGAADTAPAGVESAEADEADEAEGFTAVPKGRRRGRGRGPAAEEAAQMATPQEALPADGALAPEEEVEEEAAAAQEEEEEDEEDDGSSAGEWVTSENMHRFGLGVEPTSDLQVTCASSDYSVQNVLLQMGITPLTFDGYAVRSVKLWGLVCRACFFFTRDTQKVFCPKCGNDTVVRVPIIVDEDGQAKVLNNGRKLRTKGTIYSVPKPTQGRGWKPVFAEDELLMGGRDRERRHLERVCEKERQSRDPFNEDSSRAWWQRGSTGSGRALGVEAPRVQAGYGRKNPNANNFKHKGRGMRR